MEILAEELPKNASLDAILLLRDQLLENLLGEEIDDILYWAGKELARQKHAHSVNDLPAMFDLFSFGTLTLENQRKHKLEYRLTGEVVEERLNHHSSASFALETGYLAQQLQVIDQIYTEAIYEVKVRKKEVWITVQSDPKEPLS